jgi:hypothetical protein
VRTRTVNVINSYSFMTTSIQDPTNAWMTCIHHEKTDAAITARRLCNQVVKLSRSHVSSALRTLPRHR